MEIDQIKTFLAVATFGGFHRAAEALRISQPAVSARIKALEDSLGTSLFARSRSGLTLSEAGRILRPYAEELLRTASLASQAVHELKPASAGPLQIAAAHSISVYLLPDFLKRFQRAYPKVVISIRAGHSKEVLDMVLEPGSRNRLARSLNHPEVETLSLRDDPLLLVGHPKHGPHSLPPRPPAAGGKLAADLLRARIERLDSHPRSFPPRRSGSKRSVGSRYHRNREAHGRPRPGPGLPSSIGGRAGTSLRQTCDGQASGRRTPGPKPGRHSLLATARCGRKRRRFFR